MVNTILIEMLMLIVLSKHYAIEYVHKLIQHRNCRAARSFVDANSYKPMREICIFFSRLTIQLAGRQMKTKRTHNRWRERKNCSKRRHGEIT